MIIEELALRKGWQAILAEDGKAAIDAFQTQDFDVILMDCQMPVLDGYKATGVIRTLERQRGKHTPIIAMTANALKGDREKCLESGMDDYLSKPIDMNQVTAIIQKYVVGANHVRVVSTVVERSSVFDDNVTRLMVATGFDQETSESLLVDFCENSIKLISGINKHLAENNPKMAALLLHQLKGSSGNVRAEEISKQVLKAEEALRLMDIKVLNSLLQRIENLLKGLI